MRNHVLLAAAVLTISMLGGCRKPAASERAAAAIGRDVSDKAFDRLTDYVTGIGEGWGESVRFSGLLLVAQHDRVIYVHAFGLADRGRGRLATADTSFRIGSVTKQFTAAAVLRLEQTGKLSVSDPVKKYLPEYPGPGRDATIHQLLTHTSGIPNSNRTVDPNRGRPWTTRELLETFWSEPLEFEPGTTHKYSNSGYVVLGAIIERVSGRSYAEFLRDELFRPAGMSRTVVGDAEDDADRAVGYKVADDAVVLADPLDMSYPFAAGAVRSTANDLVRWHRALQSHDILNEQSRTKLYTPALSNYAYGWLVQRSFGRQVVHHNGGINGFRSEYWRDLDDDLVIVVLGNKKQVGTESIAKAALSVALGEEMPAAPLKPVELDRSLLPLLTGTYRLTSESEQQLVEHKVPARIIADIQTITITAAGAGVEMKPNGQPAVRLKAIGRGEFFDPASNIKATFEFGSDGAAATKVVTEQGPVRITHVR